MSITFYCRSEQSARTCREASGILQRQPERPTWRRALLRHGQVPPEYQWTGLRGHENTGRTDQTGPEKQWAPSPTTGLQPSASHHIFLHDVIRTGGGINGLMMMGKMKL